MHWIYLIIAALLESGWAFSLKFMRFKEIPTLRFHNFYKPDEGLPILLPLIAYIVLGVGNVFFLNLAFRTLPTATAFAIWTVLAIIFIKIGEVLFFHQKIVPMELFFMLLVIVGIIGLKQYAPIK